MRKKSGVYQILNKTTYKRYIGGTTDLRVRRNHHFGELRRNEHGNSSLQKAFNAYGEKNFIFEILEYTLPENLIESEQKYMNMFQSYDKNHGYNLSPTAGNNTGVKLTEKSRKKISIAKKGCAGSNKGKKLSEETKQKISTKNKGRLKTKETLQKMSLLFSGKNNPMYGKKHSKETRNKIAEKALGRYVSEETKRKMSENTFSRQVVQIAKNGAIIAEYKSAAEAGKLVNVDDSCITKCCKGKRKTAGGYMWEYAA